MRRVNPFDAGARDNFPELSPLKPIKPTTQVSKDLSYGPSDDESSSYYDDDVIDDRGMEMYGDDFDDEDVVIDAGGSGRGSRSGSGSGSELEEVSGPKAGGDGKVKKNIELDWSIDTLATVKPAEVSIHAHNTHAFLLSLISSSIPRRNSQSLNNNNNNK